MRKNLDEEGTQDEEKILCKVNINNKVNINISKYIM